MSNEYLSRLFLQIRIILLNLNGGMVTLFIQEEIQFVPQRAPAYPTQKQWSQGLSEDVRTRRTAKYGTPL
jgi:hypothetical protein